MPDETRPPSDPTLPMKGSSPTPGPDPGAPRDAARFASNEVLGGRYRLEGRLGRGGMGEVYRAHDLKLDQTVALKFLPARLGQDGAMLARLHKEVRVAREVSHPNVVRVYDIVEADGHTFLSMEYVDGEDLASLLRRIGRFPGEKGVQIARQLCVGIAAAHERGVLHRDLKPANIMIDGRGRVRITDFGLAALFDDLAAENTRAGTPAYMAPEQLAGNEVTLRSDIYSLGLVFYELFTGMRAFPGETLAELKRSRESSTPHSPSGMVADLDPIIERVILRCLEPDPRLRPASALVVAMALPGGDPLAAAVAAGETPSPEMVAEAGVSGALSSRWRIGLLIAAIVGILGGAVVSDLISPFHKSPWERPTAFLVDDARRHLEAFGIPTFPFEVHGFDVDEAGLKYLSNADTAGVWMEEMGDARPPAFRFWLRQATAPLVSTRPGEWVSPLNPPLDAGMTSIVMDGTGRLVELVHVPARFDSATVAPMETLDVSRRLFEAAGLDPADFTPVAFDTPPTLPFDRAAAFEGSFPGPMNLKATVFQLTKLGHPVLFSVQPPWRTGYFPTLDADDMSILHTWIRLFLLGVLFIVLAFFVLMTLLVRKNLRQGRVDRRGAWRLAAVFFGINLGAWFLGADHTLNPNVELVILKHALAVNLLSAVFAYGLYVLIEPYVRRQWPDALISWSRLLAGRWRDPMVGRDILIGTTAAVWLNAVGSLTRMGSGPDWWDSEMSPMGLLSMRRWLAGMLTTITSDGLFGVLVVFLVMFILRGIFRRQVVVYWVVSGLLALVTVLIAIFGGMDSATPFSSLLLALAVFVFVLRRFGLLAAIAVSVAGEIIEYIPTTLNLGAWYAPSSTFVLAVTLLLAVYGFLVSGRRVLKSPLGSSLE